MDIRYDIYQKIVKNKDEPLHITKQWEYVLIKCLQERLSEQKRAELALKVVDYVTSADLPYRLLMIRSPQAIDALKKHLKIYTTHSKYCHQELQHNVKGAVYSLKHPDVIDMPDPNTIYKYEIDYRVKRYVNGQFVSLSQYPTMFDAINDGHVVTGLDGILFWKHKRIALEISRYRQKMKKDDPCIKNLTCNVFDSFSNVSRNMIGYYIEK